MARTNYKFKKRQKELKKQKKREEKLLRKHGKKGLEADAGPDTTEEESEGHDAGADKAAQGGNPSVEG